MKKIMIYQSIEMKKDYQLSDILAYHMQVLGMDLQLFPSSWYLKILEHYVVVMCDLLLCFGGNGNHLFCHNNVWQKGWDKLFPSTPLSCFPSFYNVLILWVYLKGDWVMIYWEKKTVLNYLYKQEWWLFKMLKLA